MFLPILVVFAGYGVASYGFILIRGYNITPKQWFSPLSPYRWPADRAEPPKVPQGRVFPGGG